MYQLILCFFSPQGMFVDVTLACGGKIYSAHKFVLSTCSDYFQKIFSKNTSNNPIVFMKDVSSNDIEALLDFMYHGEVNVPQSSLGSLIKTAESLQIKGLAVPDDPPSSRKKQDREKRERDLSSSSHYESRSPPPKRRSRNSPPRRNNSARAIPPPLETCLDTKDSDNLPNRPSSSASNENHDSPAETSIPTASSALSNNRKQVNNSNDTDEHSTDADDRHNNDDQHHNAESDDGRPEASGQQDDSAGPSGLRQSKQEELVS